MPATLYDAVADLPLRIDRADHDRLRAETTSGFERVTTEITLAGNGVAGRGEDVTYDAADHDALAEVSDPAAAFGLVGEWTVDSLSGQLDDVDLFPTGAPEREASRVYRRWAFESAALDLALRQAGTDLGRALGLQPEPVRFVVSTRLGDPPSADRVAELLATDPTLEFKLDPTPDWTDEVVAALQGTDAVRVLDLKGYYEGTDVDTPADPELYRDVLAAFPSAVVEDAAFTFETRPLLEPQADRLAFDYPVTGVESLRELPVEPGWCNVKPSRFGSLRSLLATVEHCREAGIELYGGGQFELGVGRRQIQTLASLLYPEGPNDVAPRAFNERDATGPFPSSPLVPDEDRRGFAFASED